MSNTSAGRAADTILPPVLSGVTLSGGINCATQTASTSGTAGRTSLSAILPATNGKVYITVAAITVDAYIAFKKGTAAASVTTVSGWPIFAGTKEGYYLNPDELNDIEYITTGSAGTLKWYLSSPAYEGT